MPKSRTQKETVLKNLNQQFKQAKALIISVFEKLPVSEDRVLRTELKKQEVKYEVVKKTLLKKILTENKLEGLKETELKGNIAILSSSDEVTGAKILAKFIKDKPNYKIIGGILDQQWVGANQIAKLALLPSKLELIAKTMGTIKMPLNGLVNVLVGDLRGLVVVLNGIKENK